MHKEKIKAILEREFRAYLSTTLPVTVTFIDDAEAIEVSVGDHIWVCEATSDDDELWFVSRTAPEVRLPFPSDWPTA